MTTILEKKPVRNENFPCRIIDGQALIIDPASNVIKLLNEVGTKVWESINGENTGNDILQIIIDEYEVSPETAKNDLIKFLQELLTGGIIRIDNAT